MKPGQPKMRQLMAIAEARTPKARASAVPSHEDRVAQEQARQAQQLVTVKQQAIELKTQTMTVAEEVKRHIWELHGWEQAWVTEVRASIAAVRKRYEDSAREDHEYRLEDNPNAVAAPVNLLDCVFEGFSAWWDQKRDTLDWGDGRYRCGGKSTWMRIRALKCRTTCRVCAPRMKCCGIFNISMAASAQPQK
jgi:hypothetical protein